MQQIRLKTTNTQNENVWYIYGTAGLSGDSILHVSNNAGFELYINPANLEYITMEDMINSNEKSDTDV